jgi:hypothetical protein
MNADDARLEKAIDRAARARLRRVGQNEDRLPSQSANGYSTLGYDENGAMTCDCPDFAPHRPKPCKRALALLLAFEHDEPGRGPLPGADSSAPAPKPKRKTYAQDWPNYNRAGPRERSGGGLARRPVPGHP